MLVFEVAPVSIDWSALPVGNNALPRRSTSAVKPGNNVCACDRICAGAPRTLSVLPAHTALTASRAACSGFKLSRGRLAAAPDTSFSFRSVSHP